ncbi:MAG TPA: FAD-dependent oxidoreductase, partial [Candidatus Caenarcaniphilales bacterium]
MDELSTEVLVVGGGTGGTAAAIQAARSGVQTILVTEYPWLGGMLTSAGVCAPDGNELAAMQTGIWGAFLRELQQRQPQGLDHAWVSFFTYNPQVAAQIFADWIQQLPNLQWIVEPPPQEVLKQGERVTGVRFENFTIHAQLIIDATELGDLLALGEIPYRWGWELQSQWGEPSAPVNYNQLTEQYPVQAPTWVVLLQDFGVVEAPVIPSIPQANLNQFMGTWEGYSPEQFLNYGRLPADLLMINWPQKGNDYGQGLERLIQSQHSRIEFLQEARWHSQNFAQFIQMQLGRRYGLAADSFPILPGSPGGGAYALHPYYRESRRLQGLVTVVEQDILPVSSAQAARLPSNSQGQVEAIAIGNYANDHHYPGYEFALKAKAMRWGGRW